MGAYASGWICGELRAAGLIDARWLTDLMGFRGTRQAIANGDYELKQSLPQVIAGLDTDPDAAHIGVDGRVADIGDFIPFAMTPVIPPKVVAQHTILDRIKNTFGALS